MSDTTTTSTTPDNPGLFARATMQGVLTLGLVALVALMGFAALLPWFHADDNKTFTLVLQSIIPLASMAVGYYLKSATP